MENKKKRGCNYTPAEKSTIVELVNKYKNILENKQTNATIILKKRDTWNDVARQYNAVNSSGTRTWQQLRHLYENIKQRSKKNIAKENRNQFYAKEELQILKKKATNDKKEINQTGGGVFKSALTEMDAQILAMVAPQVQPLHNAYDDAALYFGDTETLVPEVQDSFIDCRLPDHDYDLESMSVIAIEADPSIPVIVNDDQELSIVDSGETGGIINRSKSVHTPIEAQEMVAEVSKEASKLKQYNKKNKGSTKEQYFKSKLKNSKLESRYIISKHKMELNKYKLELEILKLRIKKLQSPRERH